MNSGTRSMLWYVCILLIAFCVSLYYYSNLIREEPIKEIFFEFNNMSL